MLWPQVFQGVSLSFLFIPLMAMSMAGIPKEKLGNATSIFNLMRNIGGSFGISIMTTFLSRRTQFHQNRLVQNVTPGDLKALEVLHGMQGWFHMKGAGNVLASRRALGAIYGMIQKHAAMLSFVEAFWVMGVMFLVMFPFAFLLRNPRRKPSAPAAPPLPAEDKAEVYEEAPEEELVLIS